MSQTVTVKYHTHKNYCSCCGQKLSHPKLSKNKEFEFRKENIMEWADWDELMEDEDEFNAMVWKYVYDTIEFFATSSDEKIKIDPSEITKVKGFILFNVIK